jgi:putative spermidine/putrescine transport system ATP-binding protein
MAFGDSLSIVDATKMYKKSKAVDNVNLTVNKGEFLTILGPSGSGKTSLLKLISGFEEMTSGSILLNNQDITKKKAYEREIGMMFQNYALFPHMTIFDNIAYPLRIRKVPKAEIEIRVRDILKLVHLEDFGSRSPKQLSGGQQQRVALARAIVFNPPLLLLDEPLGALDKHLRQQMQLEIKHIQEKIGITTISVTHDQEEALTMSDRICVMNRGRIEQVDTPANIYQKPKNRFVAEFIGEINLFKGELVNMQTNSASVRIFDDQLTNVSLDSEWDNRQTSVFVALRPENLRVAQEASQCENTVRVKVLETIYIGEAIKAKTQTAAGQEITVKVSCHLSDLIGCGKEVDLGWNNQDATLISDEISA